MTPDGKIHVLPVSELPAGYSLPESYPFDNVPAVKAEDGTLLGFYDGVNRYQFDGKGGFMLDDGSGKVWRARATRSNHAG